MHQSRSPGSGEVHACTTICCFTHRISRSPLLAFHAKCGRTRDWGSSSDSRFGAGIGVGQLFDAGTELAVEDSTADLEQEIGAVPGPAHLLGFVHAAVDQEVGGAFGQRGADAEGFVRSRAKMRENHKG
jgi:hypothetical protein